ncbi:hypothetical protein I5G63_gp072 [Mycobacterium phage Imvubu]|uniref:Uncharacterized protein n=1 Tax=Mycobacterium phage Imvubu TaxID=2686233 RepID=A0A6B9LA08_9CAUD|nr:hypothetical protein I5G63_gp072 [Mycobacterium phage Imvubu]QHB37813.1 hypothetical protein PBI_IMVUBU_72 [Mycobacterium phage Imvubu]
MALTRDQRRAMERSMARMRERQHAAAIRPTSPVPADAPVLTPDANEGFAPEGVMREEAPAPAGPPPDKVRRVAGTMWWAAQSPAIADDQRERILEARDVVLQEAASA